MTDINRRDTSEISELSRAVFENPQVFVDRAESRFRDQLRGMTEKVAASGSHIVLLCGPSSSGKPPPPIFSSPIFPPWDGGRCVSRWMIFTVTGM